ncbi:MAG: hypothetical protein QM741_08500 [Rudaea sp.]|uniref:hypothetical protein n=1 Tax=Rudaea sp. TaxID=2136325 RepID=UPI0039E709E2
MIVEGLLAVLGVFAQPAVAAQDPVEVGTMRDAWRLCHEIKDASKRLNCYDALQDKFEPPFFEGGLTTTTPRFTINGPTLLRYQSDSVIFVMYLKDAHDKVLQNLHIGGGGEATYLIPKAGRYQLEVNGSDSWRVWIDPRPER